MRVLGLLSDPDGAEAQVQILIDGFQGSFDGHVVLELDNDRLTLKGFEK